MNYEMKQKKKKKKERRGVPVHEFVGIRKGWYACMYMYVYIILIIKSKWENTKFSI